MALFALTPDASDFLALWGFVVDVVGCIVGIVGFAYTIHQVRKVQAAADAARDAATRTLTESKASYERFVGAFASRLLSELQRAVFVREWEFAVLRCQDVAELLGTLPELNDRVERLVRELRIFGQKFADRNPDGVPKFAPTKWNAVVNDIHAFLDGLRAPFQRTSLPKETTDAERTRTEVDRGDAAPEDTQGRSELG